MNDAYRHLRDADWVASLKELGDCFGIDMLAIVVVRRTDAESGLHQPEVTILERFGIGADRQEQLAASLLAVFEAWLRESGVV